MKTLTPSSFPNTKGKSSPVGIRQVAARLPEFARKRLPASACEMSQSGLCISVCDIFLQHLYFLTKGKYKRHAEGAKGTLARFHLLFPSTPECERSLPPAPTKAADGRCGTTGEIKKQAISSTRLQNGPRRQKTPKGKLRILSGDAKKGQLKGLRTEKSLWAQKELQQGRSLQRPPRARLHPTVRQGNSPETLQPNRAVESGSQAV